MEEHPTVKKKLAAILSALLLLSALTACGPKNNASSGNASSGNAYYASAGNAYFASAGNARG